jgi:type I restriction enzyme, S subunit
MSFPKYERYKDTGVEWLAQVPEHWEVKPIRHFAEVLRGKFTHRPRNDPAFYDGDFPFIQTGDITATSRYITEHRQTLNERGVAVSREFPEGTLVMAIAANIGDVAVLTYPAYFPDSVVGLLPRKGCGPSYLYYLMRAMKQPMTIAATISTQLNINVDQIGSMVAACPPKAEQSAIATFLDRETAKIDALVDEQSRLIELLKEKRQAVISHAVTKGLDPHAPMKDAGVEWLGQVPEHWEVVRLTYLAHVQGGIAKGKDVTDRATIRVPYLRVANVQDGYLDLDEIAMIDIEPHELDRYALRPGDVLMNEGGDFDKLGRGHIWQGEIESCIHQNHVFAVRPYSIEPEWLTLITSASYSRSFFISRSKQSTNLASISMSNLQELPVIVPPAPERKGIIEHVAQETVEIDGLLAECEQAIALLAERRTALISAAVTGKIDVRGAVPAAAEAA